MDGALHQNALAFDPAGVRFPPAVAGPLAPSTRQTPVMTTPEDRTQSKDMAKNLDELVLAIARDRDREAFQALFLHFAPRLKSYLQRSGADAGEAEDVVQEAMINVWRKAALFDPSKAAVSTWVFAIARNARITHVRKQNRPEPDPNDPAFAPEPEPQPLETVSREQEARLVRDAVRDLPEEQQAVLRLAFFEDKPHAAVAEELALPLGTVKSRIRLAMRRIRAALGETR